jgi:hypothetical protein
MEASKTVTHWKKLTNPNYIGAHDFQPGQELTVTIEAVANEVVKCFDGKQLKEETCIVAKLKGAKKPLILNKTNCKIISRNLDSSYIEDWIGKSITLYVAKVRAFGESVEAIRIKANNNAVRN